MSVASRSYLTLIADAIPAVLPSLPSITIRLPFPQSRVSNEQLESESSLQSQLQESSNQLPDDFFSNNGILKAAPKKKTSHMKRRTRLYAPGKKQIKLQNNLSRCPSCGNYKRSHFMCMTCYFEIKQFWKEQVEKLNPNKGYQEEFPNKLDEQVLYPENKLRPDVEKLLKKDWVASRPKPLPVETKKPE